MKMTYQRILLIMFSISIFNYSCSKNENLKVNHLESLCIIENPPNDFTSNSCIEHPLDSTIYCERVLVDSIFKFTPEERKWLPYFCCEIGDEIQFVNNNGEETELILEEKNRGVYTVGFNGFDNCDLIDERHREYCVNREIMAVKLNSTLLGQKLNVHIEVEFDRPFELPLETGVRLEIRGNGVSHLTAFVEKENLNNVNAGNLIFHEEIELLGELFSEVHTYRNVTNNNYIEMYYNKKYGIVGFKDSDEQLWKIKK